MSSELNIWTKSVSHFTILVIVLVFNWWMSQNDPFVVNLSEKNTTMRRNRTKCNLWVPDTTKPLPEPNDSRLQTSIPVQFHRKCARYAGKNIKVYKYFHTSAREKWFKEKYQYSLIITWSNKAWYYIQHNNDAWTWLRHEMYFYYFTIIQITE